ncbi:1-acyl-sn-glycerol-3-phosphate acyltransferase delta isoform X2 [Elephas maximus indicus]|uniref:1-acyl-sn-glycerol-3-phosphate acyltransferase delta isoform X2 n=1 Tax=Elephas maximus indicus TaxID=99487 RepID=UPI00211683D6|nr:1-acyl-sn-glycerol-3-phosphate acyltransferase delta isoform X2 [Elephas maximus indicus]
MDLAGLLKSQFPCHLIFCYVFIASGLIINSIQLCTLLLWPVSKQLFRKINCRLSYCVSSQLVMLLEWWSGTECTLYTDPRDYPKYGKESAIVVLNHKFEIDFLCGWTLAERFGLLPASKVLAKKELAYVPIIGWMWYFLEMVFCKRKWEEDRKTVLKSLLNLRDYPEKFFFLIHCEGTRFTEKKHQISMQVAKAKGLPSLKYHLLPRTKGFAVTVRSLRNVVSAVYDCTLNFRNNENPTLLGVLNGKKYHSDLYVSCCLAGGFPWKTSPRTRTSALPGCTSSTRRRTPSRRSTTGEASSRRPPWRHPGGPGRCLTGCSGPRCCSTLSSGSWSAWSAAGPP